MGEKIIQTGATEPIEVLIIGADGAPLTAKHNIKFKVRRTYDNYFLDWADFTFKPAPTVTTLLRILSEVSPTYAPGEYHYSFNTSLITNPHQDDTYEITVVQDGGTDAINLPIVGELSVGYWADRIGATGSPRIIKG